MTDSEHAKKRTFSMEMVLLKSKSQSMV